MTEREWKLPATTLASTHVSDRHSVLSAEEPPTLAALVLRLLPKLLPDSSKLTLAVGSAFPE